MHRTQILLEESQYQTLRAKARRDGTSMGQVVRELLAIGLKAAQDEAKTTVSELRNLRGMFRKPTLHGRDHDRHLYGGR